jgi:hypothetical protein
MNQPATSIRTIPARGKPYTSNDARNK